MATTPNSIISPQTPNLGLVTAVNADGTANKVVITAGANGSKVVSLIGTSNDTSNRTFFIYLRRSAVNYLLGSATIQLAAGTDGSTPSVNMLASGIIPGLPVDNDGQSYLFLKSGDTLEVALTTAAVTAAKTVSFIGTFADF